MKKILLFLAVGAVALVALGLTGYTIARANGLDVRDMISGVSMPFHNRINGAPTEHRRGEGILEEYIDSAIAEAFGLTTDELAERRASGESLIDIAASQDMTVEAFQTLIQNAHQKALENAVADGVITQEQADAMLGKTFEGHSFGPMGGSPGPHHMEGFEHGWGSPGLIDEVLGLSMEEFHERLQNGESFESILENQGFTTDEFAQAVADAQIEAIQSAADEGKITQEMADTMIERIRQMLENGFPGFGAPGFHGPGRGHGHGGFGPYGPQPAVPEDSASDGEAADF